MVHQGNVPRTTGPPSEASRPYHRLGYLAAGVGTRQRFRRSSGPWSLASGTTDGDDRIVRKSLLVASPTIVAAAVLLFGVRQLGEECRVRVPGRVGAHDRVWKSGRRSRGPAQWFLDFEGTFDTTTRLRPTSRCATRSPVSWHPRESSAWVGTRNDEGLPRFAPRLAGGLTTGSASRWMSCWNLAVNAFATAFEGRLVPTDQ
jgi:hypothetical protein